MNEPVLILEAGRKPLPADDPRQRQPDIRLAREHLGWDPKTPLEQGLQLTIAYFETLLVNASRAM